MDTLQWHCPIHPPSSYKICQRRGRSMDIDHQRHPFKGVENYFTDFLLYQDPLEADSQPEEPDSGIEVVTE